LGLPDDSSPRKAAPMVGVSLIRQGGGLLIVTGAIMLAWK
jgi:hypothetical protein